MTEWEGFRDRRLRPYSNVESDIAPIMGQISALQRAFGEHASAQDRWTERQEAMHRENANRLTRLEELERQRLERLERLEDERLRIDTARRILLWIGGIAVGVITVSVSVYNAAIR